GLGLGLALDFAFDGLRRNLRRGRGLARLVAAFAHAVLEAAHGPAQVGPDVAQLLRAEDQHHDQQQDDPVNPAQATHTFASYFLLESIGPSGSGPPRMCMWT